MSISSGLNAGVAGLSVNSTKIATISDNLANSNTNGYRRTSVDFTSLLPPSIGKDFAAGVVSPNVVRSVEPRGAITDSTNATDLATTGVGMLAVTPIEDVELPASQRALRLMSTGAFRADADGYLTTSSGLALLGWPTDGLGNIGTVVRDDPSSLVPVRLASFRAAAEPTTKIDLGMNLPAAATLPGTGPLNISETTIEYFTGLGITESLRFEFVPFPPTTVFHLNVYDSATSPAPGFIAQFDVAFQKTGELAGQVQTFQVSTGSPPDANGPGTTPTVDGASGQGVVYTPDGPITLQIATNNQIQGLTMLNAPFTPNGVGKNGTPAGNLKSVEVDLDGQLSGFYDNGQQRKLFKIPVGTVPDPASLTPKSGQAFSLSSNSSDIFFSDAGDVSVGSIIGSAINLSNVDIGTELTDMIVTQRAYSANATTIRTADSMLSETTEIKR